jgi:hypothetical protein
MAAMQSDIDIFEEPTKRQMNAIKTAAIIKAIITVVFLLFILLSTFATFI